MQIDFAALNTIGNVALGKKADKPSKPSYPKSEPVLQSSYVFPKVENYGVRSFPISSPFAIPKNG